MDELVSIIVPVYNAEKYVNRVIDSILNQTHAELELVIIDDGSRDNSLSICKEKSKQDSRIKIHTQKNLGVSIARNKGIEVAEGTFIIFVDSDDYIENNMIEEMLRYFKKPGELVICGFFIHDMENNNKITVNEGNKKYQELTPKLLAKEFWTYYSAGITNSPCNKLYLTSILKNHPINFPPGIRMGEDILFNIKYFNKVSTIKIIDVPLYHYVLNPTQATRKVNLGIVNDMLLFLKKIEEFIAEHDGFKGEESLKKAHHYQIYKHLLTALQMPYRTLEIDNQVCLEYIKQMIISFELSFPNTDFIPQSVFDYTMIYLIRNHYFRSIDYSFRLIGKIRYLKNSFKKSKR